MENFESENQLNSNDFDIYGEIHKYFKYWYLSKGPGRALVINREISQMRQDGIFFTGAASKFCSKVGNRR